MDKYKKRLVALYAAGPGGWGRESAGAILGKDPADAGVKDLELLSKRALIRLFHALEAPDFVSLKGEYRAGLLPAGLTAPLAEFFTHRFFGPGRWEGKGFFPSGREKGRGYNLFSASNGRYHRTRRMVTFVGPSFIDDKPSFHLDYSHDNGFPVSTMRDELRLVNSSLLLGMGMMGISGGNLSLAPFVLFGEPTKWVGPDSD